MQGAGSFVALLRRTGTNHKQVGRQELDVATGRRDVQEVPCNVPETFQGHHPQETSVRMTLTERESGVLLSACNKAVFHLQQDLADEIEERDGHWNARRPEMRQHHHDAAQVIERKIKALRRIIKKLSRVAAAS